MSIYNYKNINCVNKPKANKLQNITSKINLNILLLILVSSLLLVSNLTVLAQNSTTQNSTQNSNIGGAILPDKTTMLRPKYSFGINYGFNSYNSSFKSLPDVENCCPKFTDASGNGLNFNLGYEHQLNNKVFIGLFISYLDRSGEYIIQEPTRVTDGNNSIDGLYNHLLNINLNYIDFRPNFSYQLIDNLFISTGINFSMPISNSYEQKEVLIQPSNKGYFLDTINNTKSRIRNEKSGDIKDLDLLIGATIGVGYEFPLNKDNTLRIKPEINYNINITNVIKDYNWRINTFAIGVSVIYTPFVTYRKTNEKYDIDTIKLESDKYANSIVVLGKSDITKDIIEGDYSEITNLLFSRTDTLFTPKVNIAKIKKENDKVINKEEVKPEIVSEIKGNLQILNPKNRNEEITEIKARVEFVKDVYPLLPYIFFEELSPVIPNRYVKVNSINEFKIANLDPNPIDYHKNNLNIIGYRMNQNTELKLTVKGYIDPMTENNQCDLATQRANNVKKYLVSVFGINENRIAVKVNNSNCFPTDLTRTQTDEGYSENRRVELESNIPELLFSLSNDRYERPFTLIPDEIVIAPNFESTTIYKKNKELISRNDFKSWSYDINLDNNDVYKTQGNNNPIYSNFVLPYKLIRDSKNDSKLNVNYYVTDNKGNNFSDSKYISVTKDTSLFEVESLTLTVFQVSQYSLDERIKKEIRKFFGNINSGAEVYIKGFSDNLGDLDANKILSQTRANAVRDYIKSIAPKAKFIESIGVGSDEFPPGVRSYILPEERFISRTVQIEIRKELEK